MFLINPFKPQAVFILNTYVIRKLTIKGVSFLGNPTTTEYEQYNPNPKIN